MNNGTATLRPRGTLWAHLGDEQAERVWGKREDPGLRPAELSDWICSGPEGGRGEGQGPDKELEAPIPDFMLTPQATRVPFPWSTRPFPDFHGCPQGLAGGP